MNEKLPQTILSLTLVHAIFFSGFFKPRLPAIVTDGLKSEGIVTLGNDSELLAVKQSVLTSS